MLAFVSPQVSSQKSISLNPYSWDFFVDVMYFFRDLLRMAGGCRFGEGSALSTTDDPSPER